MIHEIVIEMCKWLYKCVNGNTNDGNTNDGNTNDGNTNDGNTNDGNTNDGYTNVYNTVNGNTNDGNTNAFGNNLTSSLLIIDKTFYKVFSGIFFYENKFVYIYRIVFTRVIRIIMQVL